MKFAAELLDKEDENKLNALLNRFETSRQYMLGYPINCNPIVINELSPFLNYVINNLGDPYSEGNFQINSFEFEQEIIQFFESLYQGKDCWGYVTNCGSEGNLRGLLAAREKFPTGTIYYSKASHYSVQKACSVMGGQSICLNTRFDESFDPVHLESLLQKDQPAIFCLNIGTTMAGGIDSIRKVVDIAKTKGLNDLYIHCDAALLGMILPFTAPNKLGFHLPIDSIAVSGHKFLGCPIPSGVFISRAHQGEHVEYINATNGPLFGSRNGLAVLAFWCCLKKYKLAGIQNAVCHCINLARYLFDSLIKIGYDGILWNKVTNIVVFRKPPNAIIKKWQLASQGGFSHAVLMPHVTEPMIDSLVKDLKQSVFDPCL